MTWPLTCEETRELRGALRRCSDCGRRLPNHPEVMDGDAHRCFPCLWRWKHGHLASRLEGGRMSAVDITPCPGCGKASSENYGGDGRCWPCWNDADPARAKIRAGSPDGVRNAADLNGDGPRLELRVLPLEEFTAVEEDAARALLGAEGAALIPEGGDVMVYGDGGAGKTTLIVDLACHLAAGDDWLGVHVERPLRVLLIENEGPRAFFRSKLKRKQDGWAGSPLEGRIRVLEAPWATITLQDEHHREALAAAIRGQELDVVVVGPVTRAGMSEAGTLQDTAEFAKLLNDVRRRSGRAVVFVLIHHENKAGKVSGAWEGAGDTLLHVTGQGHGHTRLHIQKARWASDYHGKTLKLAWADGDGFEVDDEPDRDDNTIADEILDAVRKNGGASWNTISAVVPCNRERRKAIRDRLLENGRLVDAGGAAGMSLWHPADPVCPDLGTPEGTPEPDPGEAGRSATVPLCPRRIGAQGTGAHLAPPSTTHHDDVIELPLNGGPES
jgi:hypothetical protein